jgi:hypothetical protein
VLCDDCDKGFHWWCVGLEGIPAGNWYCSGCRPAAGASTTPAEGATGTHTLTSQHQPHRTLSRIHTNSQW